MLEFAVPKQVNSRPLIVRFGAFGDMVILTVLIRALAQRFGQPVDIVSSGGWTLPLLSGQPGIGDIFYGCKTIVFPKFIGQPIDA